MPTQSFYFRAPTKKQIEDNAASGQAAPIHRATVEVDVPSLNLADLVAILNGTDEKQIALLLESANDIIAAQVRNQLDDQPNYKEIDLSLMDVNRLTWHFIANMPKAERTSTGIADETWELFKKDYLETMVVATGKPVAVVENAAKIIAAEFKPVRDNKDKLAILETYLDMWFSRTVKGDEFASLYARLSKKVQDYQQKGLARLEI